MLLARSPYGKGCGGQKLWKLGSPRCCVLCSHVGAMHTQTKPKVIATGVSTFWAPAALWNRGAGNENVRTKLNKLFRVVLTGGCVAKLRPSQKHWPNECLPFDHTQPFRTGCGWSEGEKLSWLLFCVQCSHVSAHAYLGSYSLSVQCVHVYMYAHT